MPLSTSRLRRALDDLRGASLVATIPLEDLRMLVAGTGVPPAEQPIPSAELPGWQSVAVGSRWGSPDLTAWFSASARTPDAWRGLMEGGGRPGRFAVVLRLVLGLGSDTDGFGWPEGLLYVDGRLYQGINRHHEDVLLRPTDVAAGSLRFDVRAWSGLLPMDHRIEEAALGLVDRDAEHLYFLLREGTDLVDALDERDPLAAVLLDALQGAADRLDVSQAGADAFREAVAQTLTTLQARLAGLRAAYTPKNRPSIVAVGHGHLDVAWLWQLRHTHEKAARTFGIATALMEHYPEYHFMHTTPQVFAWLQEEYPEIWQRVLQRARDGRFELAGAMWLESDCVLVSGEALVRQIAQGQRFLRRELGTSCAVLWLPDAFGYTAALPQIMLRAGLSTFVTTKMSWSETNRIPMDTFRWRGLDGSEVLAHFITTPTLSTNPYWGHVDTYNGSLGIPSVLGAWRRYRQKDLNRELIVAFGHGDGGAGPTRQTLEQARAIQELPGAPELRMGRADETLSALRERVWTNPRLPVWDGELYFEYHRGTYTTQAWLKRSHRQAEANLLLAELLDAWTSSPAPSPTGGGAPAHGCAAGGGKGTSPPAPSGGAPRPESLSMANGVNQSTRANGEVAAPPRAGEGRAWSTLDEAWRTLLLHEFHDILPGSSIGPVYADAREAFARLHGSLAGFIQQRLAWLAAQVNVPASGQLIFNPSPWPRTALIEAPAGSESRWSVMASCGEPADGTPHMIACATQSITQGERPHVLVEVPGVPGLGYRVLVPEAATSSSSGPSARTARQRPSATNGDARGPARAEGRVLENDFFRLELDDAGAIASLVDKRVPGRRELFRLGAPGNQLLLFHDQPEAFDAWNIDATYEARSYPLGPAELAVTETGQLRATIRVQRSFGRSRITQEISLYRTIPRVDFATHIDWHEHHRLLKAAFPLDLRATQATYEVQYGSMQRATHRNTSWDQARFEVWAHRWVDLSESDYGVSLLNDGRYGHDVHDATLRISLMRGPTYPDPEADQGNHFVTYSLYPHPGDWRTGGTITAAYALNRPAWAVQSRDETTEPTESMEIEATKTTHPEKERSPERITKHRSAGDKQTIPSSPSVSSVVANPVSASFFMAEPLAVVIEAVKRADDGNGLIVRVYESHGGRHAARVRSLFSVAHVEECDLLERPLTPDGSPAHAEWSASPVVSQDVPVWDATGWSFALRPFEIRTFRVHVQR